MGGDLVATAPSSKEELITYLEELGGCILREDNRGFSIELFEIAEDAHIRWMRQLFEPAEILHLEVDESMITDAACRDIAAFLGLEFLNLRATQVTDDGIAAFANHPALQGVQVDGTQITDAGVSLLATIRPLADLGLVHTRITDAAVLSLRGHPSIESLSMQTCGISDDCVDSLISMPKLWMVNVAKTGMSRDGIERLHSARPDVTIFFSGGKSPGWSGGKYEGTTEANRKKNQG